MILYHFTRRASRSMRFNSETLVNWQGLANARRVFVGPVELWRNGITTHAKWRQQGRPVQRTISFVLLDDNTTPPTVRYHGLPLEKVRRLWPEFPRFVIGADGNIYDTADAERVVRVMEGPTP